MRHFIIRLQNTNDGVPSESNFLTRNFFLFGDCLYVHNPFWKAVAKTLAKGILWLRCGSPCGLVYYALYPSEYANILKNRI